MHALALQFYHQKMHSFPNHQSHLKLMIKDIQEFGISETEFKNQLDSNPIYKFEEIKYLIKSEILYP